MKDAEQEAFEAFCKSKGIGYRTRRRGDGYSTEYTQRAWMGWQASAKHKRLSTEVSVGEFEQIGKIVEIDDGCGTKFAEWLNNKWDLPAGTKIYARAAIEGLEFEPSEQYAVTDMANVGYEYMQILRETHADYTWCQSPVELFVALIDEIDDMKEDNIKRIEREQLGDFDQKTGIYAERAPIPAPQVAPVLEPSGNPGELNRVAQGEERATFEAWRKKAGFLNAASPWEAWQASAKHKREACPFPCGWLGLYTLAVQDGAYLARAEWPDEDVDGVRATTMRVIGYLTQVCGAMLNPPKRDQSPDAPANEWPDLELVNLIARDVCETEPADPGRDDTVCIGVDDLKIILERHVKRLSPDAASGGEVKLPPLPVPAPFLTTAGCIYSESQMRQYARAAVALNTTAAGAQGDAARLNWLDAELVDTIYLDDGRIIDVGGSAHSGRLRAAIDAARNGDNHA